MRILSPSQIATYLNCPCNWYFNYIEKLPRTQSEAAFIGTIVHDTLFKFFDNIDKNKCTVEEFEKILFSLIRGVIKKTGQKVDKIKYAHFLKNFAKFEHMRYLNIMKKGLDFNKYFMPIAREKKMVSDKLGLLGIVDRIDRVSEREYAVVDYKTGKNNPKYKSDIRRQMCIYKMLVEDSVEFDFVPEFIIGIYPLYDNLEEYLFMEKLKKVSITSTLKAIQKVRDGIKNESFEPNPTMLCGWCSHPEACEKRRRQSEWWSI